MEGPPVEGQGNCPLPSRVPLFEFLGESSNLRLPIPLARLRSRNECFRIRRRNHTTIGGATRILEQSASAIIDRNGFEMTKRVADEVDRRRLADQ